MNMQKETIKGYKNLNIPYSLITHEEQSNKLAIFLPGAGYTTQKPLFHYSEEILLKKGFDVLNVNYRYNDADYDSFDMDELSTAIKVDVQIVIDEVLKNGVYKEFYLVAKSLGTIALCTELERAAFKDAKVVWLTPLIHRDDVLDKMVRSTNKGLSFIGDNDYCYSEERYKLLAENPHLVSRLIPNVDHSMEYKGDPFKSIDALKTIMEEINQF
ncbi:alpha/beta hydrolase [Planococcus liqunii]|uniref:alpha/beta hydrolase n=1 Tax=Planococcus liqunii TaxID=3058394 RepID=UPI002620DE4C|nr:alpha/beta hydrolase [Planococcus sp. N056]WKA49390.1 alpha/beta hydrolase [Planococcus sp. N056]